MDQVKYSNLLRELLPKGDAWQCETDTEFFKIITAVAKSFYRVQQNIDALREQSFPDSDQTLWSKDSLVSFQRELASLSKTSIQQQLNESGYRDIEISGNSPSPGDANNVFFAIPTKNVRFLSAGDPVGTKINSFNDDALEDEIRKIVPAHCQVNYIYKEKTDEAD